jgi:hypothetical protein
MWVSGFLILWFPERRVLFVRENILDVLNLYRLRKDNHDKSIGCVWTSLDHLTPYGSRSLDP